MSGGDGEPARRKRRWRFYRTPAGHEPVADFLDSLSTEDAAQIVAAMREVAQVGLVAARHVRNEMYEVRATGRNQTYRILFATEGRARHILLALEGFSKKTQRTPPHLIDLAEQRLTDWRLRGTNH